MEDHGRDTGLGSRQYDSPKEGLCGASNPLVGAARASDNAVINPPAKPLMDGFGTGATRSTAQNAIDFEGHIAPEVWQLFGEYMHAHRIQADGVPRASDNWQKGISLHRYLKSLLRHTFDLWLAWRGITTYDRITKQPQTLGDLGAAILFNTQGFLFELIHAGARGDQFPPVKWHYVTREQRQRVEEHAEKAGNSVIHELSPTPVQCGAVDGWKHPEWTPPLPPPGGDMPLKLDGTQNPLSREHVRTDRNVPKGVLADADLDEGTYRLTIERERY